MTQIPPSAALSGPQSAVQAYAGTLPHLAVPGESWGHCVGLA